MDLTSSLMLDRSTLTKSASSSFSVATGTTCNSPLISSFPEPLPPVLALPSEDEPLKHAILYPSLPVPLPSQMPQTVHFSDFSHFHVKPPTPAAPMPDNARLSLGEAHF